MVDCEERLDFQNLKSVTRGEAGEAVFFVPLKVGGQLVFRLQERHAQNRVPSRLDTRYNSAPISSGFCTCSRTAIPIIASKQPSLNGMRSNDPYTCRLPRPLPRH